MLKYIKSNDFLKNSLILFSGSMLGNIFNYIYHLVVGRMVSPSVYGEIESLISLMSIISVPSMALIMLVTKYTAANRADDSAADSKRLFDNLTRKLLFVGVAMFLVLSLFNRVIGDALKIDNYWAFSFVWLSMLLSFFTSITLGILNGWQKFKASSLSVAWGAGAKLLVVIGLLYAGFRTGGAMGSFVIAGATTYIISLLYLKFILKHKTAGAKEDEIKLSLTEVKKLIIPFLLGNLAINILGNADMVLAKRNLEDVVAGQYGALNIVGKIIFFATGVIATVVFSMAAENAHKKTSSKKLLMNATLIIGVVCAFSVVAYFLMPKFILGLLFGQKYAVVAGYLGWFALAVSIYSLNNLYIQFFLSFKAVKIIALLLGISFLMCAAIFLYGQSISAIITIVIIFQLLALVTELLFIYNVQTSKQT